MSLAGLSFPVVITGGLLGLELTLLTPLLVPLPNELRLKAIRTVLESRIVAKALYGFKICLIFVAVLAADAGNTLMRLELQKRGRNIGMPEPDIPVSSDLGMQNDMTARKLVAERNLAVSMTTLIVYVVLWRVFDRELELQHLKEQIQKLKGVIPDDPISASVAKHHAIADDEHEKRKPVPQGLEARTNANADNDF